MNRKLFYDMIRKPTFAGSLGVTQVAGLDLLLDEAERRGVPRNDLAYALATAFHETARTMQPIHERGAVSYFNKYEPGTSIGRMLGNTLKGDGYKFRGRGFVQLTGRRNYALASKKLGIDLLADPDQALQPKVAAAIMYVGMKEGWFTGKGFASYIDDADESDKEDLREYVNARRIINGTDRASTIGGYAIQFEQALTASGYPVGGRIPVLAPGAPVGAPPDVPGTPPAPPLPPDAPSEPAGLPEAPQEGLLARFFRWLFGGATS